MITTFYRIQNAINRTFLLYFVRITAYISFMSKTLDLNKIKTAIKHSGLRTQWIAEKIGVGPRTLGGYLAGRQNLGRSAQILLLQVLEINEADVLKKAS